MQTYILSYSKMKVRKAVDEGKTIQKLPRCLCVCRGMCLCEGGRVGREEKSQNTEHLKR